MKKRIIELIVLYSNKSITLNSCPFQAQTLYINLEKFVFYFKGIQFSTNMGGVTMKNFNKCTFFSVSLVHSPPKFEDVQPIHVHIKRFSSTFHKISIFAIFL